MVSGSKNNSRIKTGKSSNKMVFAKDKKQVVLMVVVLSVFCLNSLYLVVKSIMEKTAQSKPQQSLTVSNSADILAQEGLENLTEQTPGTVANDSQNKVEDINNTAVQNNNNVVQDANSIYSQTVALQKNMPNKNLKTSSGAEGDIEIIPVPKKTLKNGIEKTVEIAVTNSGRLNPFLPENEYHTSLTPSNAYSYLLPPPETLPGSNDASKVMSTTISGILYDKYSPSAIINIEGTDYLVKRGDVINNYKILSISPSQVVVQRGKNVYQAGVGELLVQTDLNYNTVANLNKKFGGNDVIINVKKKGY